MGAAETFLLNFPCRLVGDDKIQLPPGVPPDQVILAKAMKPALLALLLQDRRDLAEERAGILEFDAGLARQEAERRAGLASPKVEEPSSPLNLRRNEGATLGRQESAQASHARPSQK